MDILLLVGAVFLLAAFVYAQVRSLARWRGGWRIAAVLPLLGLLFVLARIVFDTQRDPTSHNLWPLEIVFATVIALAALGLLHIARLASRARTPTTT